MNSDAHIVYVVLYHEGDREFKFFFETEEEARDWQHVLEHFFGAESDDVTILERTVDLVYGDILGEHII